MHENTKVYFRKNVCEFRESLQADSGERWLLTAARWIQLNLNSTTPSPAPSPSSSPREISNLSVVFEFFPVVFEPKDGSEGAEN